MRDIDILGIAVDGKRLLAQVTFGGLADVTWKIERLRQYRDPKRAHLVLFCRCEEQMTKDGVKFVPIENVYRDFSGILSGKRWLKWSA